MNVQCLLHTIEKLQDGSVPFLTKVFCCNQSHFFTKANGCAGFSSKYIAIYHTSSFKEIKQGICFSVTAAHDRWALALMGATVPTRTSPPLAARVCSYKGSNSLVCLHLSLGNLVHLSGAFEAEREHQGYCREWLLGVHVHQPHQSARRARETWGWLRPPDPDIHSSTSLYPSLCPRENH